MLNEANFSSYVHTCRHHGQRRHLLEYVEIDIIKYSYGPGAWYHHGIQLYIYFDADEGKYQYI